MHVRQACEHDSSASCRAHVAGFAYGRVLPFSQPQGLTRALATQNTDINLLDESDDEYDDGVGESRGNPHQQLAGKARVPLSF